MIGDTQGSRIRAVRDARDEALEPFAAAMNALLPREEHARSTTVWRWEKNEGSPSVLQGWAITQLDPERRDLYWLADKPAPARHSSSAPTAKPQPVIKVEPKRLDVKRRGKSG